MDLIGKKIGDYRIRSELGRGGMGIVYEAVQESLQRVVALKVLPPQLALEQQFVERFKREAAAIARLEHRNIVRLIDHLEQDNLYCIVMEFVRGQSVKSLISGRPLAIDFSIRVGMQVAEALAYAHEQGIIHRDIKPENIMICEGETVKVMDFGIAKVGGSGFQTKTGLAVGTPEYMSPEQARGDKNLDAKTDIYSLGVVLYEILTGTPPFSGEPFSVAYKHVHEEPEPPKARNSRISSRLSEVVVKCLKKDRSERFQSARELVTELYSVAMSEGISVEKGTLILQRERAGESFASAKEAYASGETERAARLLRKALVLDPDNAEAKALLDEIKGKSEEKRRKEEEAEKLLAQAKDALKGEDLEEARGLAAMALELVPGLAEAQSVFDDAQGRLAAIELQRKQVEVAAHLSAAQDAFGGADRNRAFEEAKAVLALEPNNAAAAQIVDAIRSERARARGRLVLRAAGIAVVLAVVAGGVIFAGRARQKMATASLSKGIEQSLGARGALVRRLEVSGLMGLPEVGVALAAFDEALSRAKAAMANGEADQVRIYVAEAASHLAKAEEAASRTLADDSKAMGAALAAARSALDGLDKKLADLSAVSDTTELAGELSKNLAVVNEATSLSGAGHLAEARAAAESVREPAVALAGKVRQARESAARILGLRRDAAVEARQELISSTSALSATEGRGAGEPAGLESTLSTAGDALSAGQLAVVSAKLSEAETALGEWRKRVNAALATGRESLARLADDLNGRATQAKSQAQALIADGYKIPSLGKFDMALVDLGIASDGLRAGVGLDSVAAALERAKSGVEAVESEVGAALSTVKAETSDKVARAKEALAAAGDVDQERKEEFSAKARALGDQLLAATGYEQLKEVASDADGIAAAAGEALRVAQAELAARRVKADGAIAGASGALKEAEALSGAVPAESKAQAETLLGRARASLAEAQAAFSDGRYNDAAGAATAATSAAESMKQLASGDASFYARGVAAFASGDFAAAAKAFGEVSAGYRRAAEYLDTSRFNAGAVSYNEALAQMRQTRGESGVDVMERLLDEFNGLSGSSVPAVAEPARELKSMCVQLVGNKGQLLEAVLRLAVPAKTLSAPE